MGKFCVKCGNEGFADRACPECGFDRSKLNLVIKDPDEIKAFINDMERTAIPKQYQGVEWEKSKLIESHQLLANDIKFMKYAEQLEKIHKIFALGTVPSKSAIIIAPPKFSKETWAFSCMQQALLRGLKVARLLDTVEAKRVAVLASENPKYKLYNEVLYDDYLDSDVLFLTITKTQYKTDAGHIIMELLDRRSRLGRPTFIISRYQLKELVWKEKWEEFESIIDYNNTENSIKYPAIISYRKGFGTDGNYQNQ